MSGANAIGTSISTPYSDPIQESARITQKVQLDIAELSREEPAVVSKDVYPAQEEISKIVENVNQFVREVSRKVSFTYDERSESPVIIVQNDETGKVIRQIPPEEMLKLMAKLEDVAGIIYHDKA